MAWGEGGGAWVVQWLVSNFYTILTLYSIAANLASRCTKGLSGEDDYDSEQNGAARWIHSLEDTSLADGSVLALPLWPGCEFP